MHKHTTPLTIGWREWAALPELGVAHIKTKIDTGARTSALNAHNISPITHAGAPHIAFQLQANQPARTIDCIEPIVDQRNIKSSNGDIELRYIIHTTLQIGPISWPIDISLTQRDDLSFPLLLGRHALRGHFIIDPQASYMYGKP